MSASRALRRLLRFLQVEEEQARANQEIAGAELRRLEKLRLWAAERERAGRQLMAAGARGGEKTDWLVGLEEVRTARRLGAMLIEHIAAAERERAALRAAYLAKRAERQQTGTLVEEAEARAAAEAARRAQQATDEWFLERRRAEQRTPPDSLAETKNC